jgi:tetrapyrrole methylase family protein/MazG family protein
VGSIIFWQIPDLEIFMKFKECSIILAELGFDEGNNIVLINGDQLFNKFTLLHSSDEFALYWFTKESLTNKKIQELVHKNYRDSYSITQIFTKTDTTFEIDTQALGDICFDRLSEQGGYLFFEPETEKTSITKFIDLIAHLRAPDGCPWDRKQTLQTLRTNLLEETHEVLETIDNQDMEGLKEELGDLILQIVLQAQIASENRDFDLYDVINGIYKKIIFRHPHIFGDIKVDGVNGVLQNWEKWKAEERINKKKPENISILASVPKSLPALSLAQKYQERAARVGFDWPEIAPVFDKIEEEIEEVKNAEGKTSQESELGDLLFALVNLIRWYGFDAESLLRQMNQRFLSRFSYIEYEVARQGRNMTDLSLSELDGIWDQAKKAEVIKAQSAL